MKYTLKYNETSFYKIYSKSVYYGNWAEQIWKKDSWKYLKNGDLQNISYSLLIKAFYKNTVSMKNNKRFINEAFKYLLEKSK